MKLAMAFALALAGCATPPPITYVNQFNADEVAFIHNEGTNTITGSGFLRQRGGGIVRCSGNAVWLIPEGAYSRERIGSRAPFTRAAIAYNREPRLWQHARRTACNVDARFRFDDVPRGSFYVVSYLSWEIPSIDRVLPNIVGGTMIRQVSFNSDYETKEVTLSQ